jgi:hypothetical protein
VPDIASELVVFLVGWLPLTLEFHLAKASNEIADATRLHDDSTVTGKSRQKTKQRILVVRTQESGPRLVLAGSSLRPALIDSEFDSRW